VGRVRREHQLAALRLRFEREICGGAVSGTRLDNLICDGWLPLLAAHGAMEFAGLWFHWFPGDAPALLRQALFDLGVCSVRRRPVCHGLIQGLLDWMLAREREEFTVPPETLGRGA